MPPEIRIDGTCEPRFQPVAEAFRRNFSEHDEIGASLAVIHEGRLVLDLWGGYADLSRSRPWERDTIVNVFSTTKMVAALCVLHLAGKGALDLDAPLAQYWAEFGRHGKEGILVCHVLAHTAGVPGFTPPLQFADLYDWQKIARLLEEEVPLWAPGKKLAYHTLTYGFLLGELVRRVSGRTLGRYLQEEICAPLGIDFHIGLPATEEGRVADIVPAQEKAPPLLLAFARTAYPLAFRAGFNPFFTAADFNSPSCHAAEIPAGNGIGNARAVARLGAILAGGGVLDGNQVLPPGIVDRAVSEQARGRDPVAFGRLSAWGLGVMLYNPSLLPARRSCYATGLGGSVCLMDLERNVTLAYVMNRMAELKEGDARSIPLAQALWRCLDDGMNE